jgi:DNA mismatch endonuclease (patch repair protein)
VLLAQLQLQLHLHLPKANAGYWIPKLARNVERDAEVTAILWGLGWTVLRFWEHESPKVVEDAIIATVERGRSSVPPWIEPPAGRRGDRSQ